MAAGKVSNYVQLRRFSFPFPSFNLKLDLVARILFYYALGSFLFLVACSFGLFN